METNNFNKEPTKSDDSETDDTTGVKSKKKKSAGSAAIQAEVASDRQRPEQKSSTIDSIWQKIKGEKLPSKKPEVLLFGIPNPEQPETAKSESSLNEASESDTSLQELNPEVLSPEELQEAAREFTQLRIHETDGEMHELPFDPQTPDAAEAAAGAALLQNMKANLNDENVSVEAALDNAARRTQEQMDDSMRPMPESQQGPLDMAAGNENIAETEQDQMVNRPEAGGGNNEPPETPPPTAGEYADFPPPLPPPVTPGFHDRPRTAAYVPAGTYASAIENGSSVSTAAALRNERVAQSRGLLVGLLVGNFIGKRRGRNMTEKKLAPVQRKLEKQITNLQETIAAREQQIKSAAREKFATLTSRGERQKFVDSMTQVREDARAENAISGGTARRSAAAETNPAPNTRYAEAALIGSRAVGELVAGGILAATAGSSLSKTERAPAGGAQLSAERTVNNPNLQPVVRFDKRAEDLSRSELLQTAEKIKIEGVDLKEMLELGRIDEAGLRRIVHEFLEGGSVSAALSKEVQEKELKFERDPRMRQLLGDGSHTGGGASGAPDSPETLAVQNIGLSAMNMTFQNERADKPAPTPDKATLQKVRNQQIATVGGTVLVITAFILVALWLTR